MNIELHGFLDDQFERLGVDILRRLCLSMPDTAEDFAVTSAKDRSYNVDGKNKPFYRVYTDKESDFHIATMAIRGTTTCDGTHENVVIEFVLLAKCITVSR